MRTKITSISLAVSLCFAAFTASASDELVMATEKAGGRSALSLDFATEGNAVALQFNISVPKGTSAAQIDLKSCLADLPKSHAGNCVYNEKAGEIIGLVYSDANEVLPSGVVSIGHIGLKGLASDNLKVAQFLVSGADAQPIEAKASLAQPGATAKSK